MNNKNSNFLCSKIDLKKISNYWKLAIIIVVACITYMYFTTALVPIISNCALSIIGMKLYEKVKAHLDSIDTLKKLTTNEKKIVRHLMIHNTISDKEIKSIMAK